MNAVQFNLILLFQPNRHCSLLIALHIHVFSERQQFSESHWKTAHGVNYKINEEKEEWIFKQMSVGKGRERKLRLSRGREINLTLKGENGSIHDKWTFTRVMDTCKRQDVSLSRWCLTWKKQANLCKRSENIYSPAWMLQKVYHDHVTMERALFVV